MHFCFAGQEGLEKLPVQEFWERQSTARTGRLMARLVMSVSRVFHSTEVHP